MSAIHLTFRQAVLLSVLAFVFCAQAPTPAFACAAGTQDCHGTCIPQTYQCILEPWPGMPEFFDPSAASGPLSPFYNYVNSGVWSFMFRVGVAVAILNGVYGGFLIVKSNGESGQIDEGKQRFLWSGIGLIILILSGAILAFINPAGFGVA